jgi:hypothetical protein
MASTDFRCTLLVALIAVVYFVGAPPAKAQECLGIRNELPQSDNELCAVSSVSLPKNKSEKRKQAEALLKRELAVLMSERIMTRVNTGSLSAVREENGRLSQYFSSETVVHSNAQLGYLTFDFCFDRLHKRLYGKCTILKKELAASIEKDCVSRLTALVSEIEGKQASSSRVGIKSLKDKFVSTSADYRTSLYLNSTQDSKEWNELVRSYQREIAQLESSQEQLEYETIFTEVQDSMKKGSYYSAILLMKAMRGRFRDNEEIALTMRIALDEYGAQVKQSVPRWIANHDYEKALVEIDQYCTLATCGDEIRRLEKEAKEEFFDYEFDELKLSIKYNEEKKVDEHFAQLDRLRDGNPQKFMDATAAHLDYKRKVGYEKVQLQLDRHNYARALEYLNDLEYKYGKRDNEIQQLRDKVENKLYREKVRQIKQSRPHNWALELGACGYSNSEILRDFNTYKLQTLHLSPTIGLYRKYRYELYSGAKGYPVESDLIGIRLRYIDFPSRWLVQERSKYTDSLLTGFQVDAGISGITWRHIHYGFGASFRSLDAIQTPRAYFGELGIRLPIGRLSLMADARVTSERFGETYFNFTCGVFIRLDFQRRFGKADKKAIRSAVRSMSSGF